MSEQDTTAAVADVPSQDKEPSTELVKVQVIAAGFSYFIKNKVLGPDGEQLENPLTGRLEFVTLRHEAKMGDVIKLPPYTAAIATKDGFVREPSSAPLLPGPMATPFSTPVGVGPDGEPSAFPGPIMGDPRPNSAEETGADVDRLPLTPDQIAELQARQEQREAVDGFAIEEATDDEVQAKVNELNVDETLQLARGLDGEFDELRVVRVLEAEMARETPRAGVVGPLEKATEGS